MLKALFLDLDETLCNTQGANEQAKHLMAQYIERIPTHYRTTK